MQLQITGHHVEITPALHERAEQKIQHLLSHAPKIISAHVTLEVNKLRHIAEATLAIPKSTIHAKAESENMYKSLDLLANKLMTQLIKHKEKETTY